MKYLISVFPLILFASVAHAGQFRVLVGTDAVVLNKGIDGDTFVGLYSLGTEYTYGEYFSYGLNAGFSFSENDNAEGIKGDGYVKYNIRPKRKINPYLSAGISAVAFKYLDYEWMYGNDGGGSYAYYGTKSTTVRSFGATYQIGTTIKFSKLIQVDTYWSQFFGTNDLLLNIVGVRVIF